jgi:DNA-binding transcriptional MerR regulator
MSNLTNREVGRRADVNLETIRFYERKGLLPKPRRSPSGCRRFTVFRGRFMRQAQGLGERLIRVG